MLSICRLRGEQLTWLNLAFQTVVIYYFTTLLVACSLLFGFREVDRAQKVDSDRGDLLTWASRWDGGHYISILDEGYQYRPSDPSNLAFFPLFPVLANVVVRAGGIEARMALLITAHALLIGSFIILVLYVQARDNMRAHIVGHGLLALALCPTTFFFRMNYSESTFLFLALMTF